VLHGAGPGPSQVCNHTYTVEGNYVRHAISVTQAAGPPRRLRARRPCFGYVTSLYEVLLGREPDNGGLS